MGLVFRIDFYIGEGNIGECFTFLQEFKEVRLVNLSISKTLMNDKLHIVAGANNMLNQSMIETTTYQLFDINKIAIDRSDVILDRGRTFFMRIALTI